MPSGAQAINFSLPVIQIALAGGILFAGKRAG